MPPKAPRFCAGAALRGTWRLPNRSPCCCNCGRTCSGDGRAMFCRASPRYCVRRDWLAYGTPARCEASCAHTTNNAAVQKVSAGRNDPVLVVRYRRRRGTRNEPTPQLVAHEQTCQAPFGQCDGRGGRPYDPRLTFPAPVIIGSFKKHFPGSKERIELQDLVLLLARIPHGPPPTSYTLCLSNATPTARFPAAES